MELLGGEIFLDKEYDSGIPGNPGTSIIINLKRAPLSEKELADGLDTDDHSAAAAAPMGASQRTTNGNSQSSDDRSLWEGKELPEHLTVLFVGELIGFLFLCGVFRDEKKDESSLFLNAAIDDDAILRKLFARSVRRVAPGWTMHEASNGESALQLLDQGLKFDLIFVDQ